MMTSWIQRQLSLFVKTAHTHSPHNTGNSSSSSESQHRFVSRGRRAHLGFLPTVLICRSYLALYKVSLDGSFTLWWAQLQRTWGISSGSYFYPSAGEQSPNSCFNPWARCRGRILCPRAANQRRPPANELFDGADSGLTSQHIPTLQHAVYLVGGQLISWA